MTLEGLNSYIVSTLSPVLGSREAAATARLLLEDILDVTPTKLILSADRPLEPETEAKFRRIVGRIAAGEPPQYVVGRARFMGMDLKVTPATLIPRPETAALVDLITDRADGRPNLRVLDIGTGSGCIAIALARALPFPQITALDISPDALAVAADNARALRADIDFIHADILASTLPVNAADFDIIVSNPPYIAESERPAIEPRVKDFEPADALFVPDSDPLVFYRHIARFASDGSATLFFEINPLFSENLRDVLRDEGYMCDILPDYHGKPRFAIAAKP